MIRNALIVAPQGLGDSLESTPMFSALLAAEPHARVDVLVLREPARKLFSSLPGVGTVYHLPYWEKGALAFARSLLMSGVLRNSYDLTLLAYPAARPEYLALLAMVRGRRKFAHSYCGTPMRSLLSRGVRFVAVRSTHNVYRNLDLLTTAGYGFTPPQGYTVPESWVDPHRGSDRRIIVHIGSIAHNGLEARRWPIESFRELVARLLRRNYEVALLTGPAERAETYALSRQLPGVEVIEEDLPTTARLLSRAPLVISNDSGIGHLAAGVGARVVALFGPTDAHHAPFGAGVRVLRPTTCPPCFDVVKTDATCKLNIDYKCLKKDLPVDYVLAHVVEIIETSRSTA